MPENNAHFIDTNIWLYALLDTQDWFDIRYHMTAYHPVSNATDSHLCLGEGRGVKVPCSRQDLGCSKVGRLTDL